MGKIINALEKAFLTAKWIIAVGGWECLIKLVEFSEFNCAGKDNSSKPQSPDCVSDSLNCLQCSLEI